MMQRRIAHRSCYSNDNNYSCKSQESSKLYTFKDKPDNISRVYIELFKRGRTNSVGSISAIIFIIVLVLTILSTISVMQRTDVINNFAMNPWSAPRIPNRMIFLDTRYDTIHDIPSPFQETIQDSVEKYLTLWNDKTVYGNYNSHYDKMQAMLDSPGVLYLNNQTCIDKLSEIHQDLVQFYLSNVTKGQDKADICRVAALYLHGGYYIDTDMPVVKPVSIEPHITFLSPWESEKSLAGLKGVFNSFMAVAPRHPILKSNIEIFLRTWKRDQYDEYGILGTETLYEALLSFTGLSDREAQMILHKEYKYSDTHQKNDIRSHWPLDLSYAEVLLSNTTYPDFPRHDNTNEEDYRCNYVVHQIEEGEVYFYSRMPGAGANCPMRDKIPRKVILVEPKYSNSSQLEDVNSSKKVQQLEQLTRDYWTKVNKGESTVVTLFDDDCREVVQRVESRLYPRYVNEDESLENRREICKLCYLYEKGGYSLDTGNEDDMAHHLLSYTLESNVTLVQPIKYASAAESRNDNFEIIEDVMATAARHPLLRIRLDRLVNDYDTSSKRKEEMKPTISHNEKVISARKSDILSWKEFWGRTKKGYRLSDWVVDFSIYNSTG